MAQQPTSTVLYEDCDKTKPVLVSWTDISDPSTWTYTNPQDGSSWTGDTTTLGGLGGGGDASIVDNTDGTAKITIGGVECDLSTHRLDGCVDGAVQFTDTKTDEVVKFSSQQVRRRINHPFNQDDYDADTPTGPVAGREVCGTFSLVGCEPTVDVEYSYGILHTDNQAAEGWVATRPQISWDGGATYSNFGLGGADNAYFDGPAGGETQFEAQAAMSFPTGTASVTICISETLQTNNMTSGQFSLSAAQAIIHTSEMRCC